MFSWRSNLCSIFNERKRKYGLTLICAYLGLKDLSGLGRDTAGALLHPALPCFDGEAASIRRCSNSK
jgi:hypothetical protein